jgi:hypothetical protein
MDERPLDPIYQDAEDTFAGRCALIERAARNTGAKKTWARVLRWYLEHNAQEREVVASPRQIAASFWLDVCERTVQRAHAHWKRLGALTFTRREDENGANLPPCASLNWAKVQALACVQPIDPATRPAQTGHSAGASVASREVTEGRLDQEGPAGLLVATTDGPARASCGAACHHPPGDSLVSPSHGDKSPSPGDKSPSPGDFSPMIPNEEKVSNSSKIQRTTQRESSWGSLGAPVGRAAASAEPAEAGVTGETARRMPEVLAEFFNEAVADFRDCGDHQQQREIWKRRINVAVGHPPERDWWVAGKTAGLVAGGQIEERRVKRFCESVSSRRLLPPGEEHRIDDPAGWFQKVVARLCNERGIAFAKSRVIQEKPR